MAKGNSRLKVVQCYNSNTETIKVTLLFQIKFRNLIIDLAIAHKILIRLCVHLIWNYMIIRPNTLNKQSI